MVRMPDKSSNVPFTIVYSSISVESLRTAGARNNPEYFSTATKQIIARMRWQGLSTGKLNSFILKYFNKHEVNFDNVFQSKHKLLNLVSYIINTYIFIHSGQPITFITIAMEIRR